jgi:phenylpropionate dioxygenase-like ring-hydroxylating dioxygenase large terminal subunit
MFLKDCWYAAALADELSTTPLARTICGEPIALFRTASGRASALEDRCPHRFAPLSIAIVSGEQVTCRYHGIQFDCTGRCLDIPQQEHIPETMRVRSYPLVERWGVAWIWMGDSSVMNPETVPNYYWLSAPEWRNIFRRYHVAANFEVCADNILDLSHTPFVHTRTIGTPEMAKIPVKTWVDGDRVYSRRVMQQVTPGPFVYRWGNFGDRIDRVTTTEWLPPGNISVELSYEDASNRITLRLTNPLTPETERTTHCFFMWSRDFGSTVDEAFTTESFQVMAEDIAIIEHQQAVIDRGLPVPTIAITADATLIQARRVVERLRSEQSRARKAITESAELNEKQSRDKIAVLGG